MFLVFNKQKIYSYMIALATVIILFCGASFFKIDDLYTVQTGATTQKMLPIYSVETKEKNVALTINCAWNAVDRILDTLSKYKVHVTFFVVGDWVDKYPDALKKIADNRT